LEENPNVASVVGVDPLGPAVIVVSGGVVSAAVLMRRLLGFGAWRSSAVMKAPLDDGLVMAKHRCPWATELTGSVNSTHPAPVG
jgi:hypothetical protein